MCQTHPDYGLHVSERSRGPGSHVSRGRGQVCTGPRLPAQGALPRLKHVLHSCLSSHHLAPFSWVPAGLSACARCAWRKARAVSATQRGPGWAVWGTGRDGSRVRGARKQPEHGYSFNRYLSIRFLPSAVVGAREIAEKDTDKPVPWGGGSLVNRSVRW